MRTRIVWEGKLASASPFLILYVADLHVRRTMVWAIDLDDGTLIGDLGESLGRPKSPDLGPDPPYVPCFGASGWPETSDNSTS